MPPTIDPRQTQTKVKHLILEKYLSAWGGIIVGGNQHRVKLPSKNGRPFEIHLVYVDCNTSCGRYNGESEDHHAGRNVEPVFGSPIIGVRELDKIVTWAQETHGIHVRTNAILIEKERGPYEELKNSLMLAGLDHRACYTDDFNSLKDGEFAVMCADSTQLASKLVAYTQQDNTFSLYFIDPYGAVGSPLSFVKDIISRPRHDTIIFMHYAHLSRKGGSLSRATISPANQKQLEYWDAHFGHKGWRHIAQRLVNKSDESYIEGDDDEVYIVTEESDDPEYELMKCYQDALQAQDSKLIIKSINLQYPSTDKTIYYLYLTTHDPSGALTMNEKLHQAVKEEKRLRWRLKKTKQRGKQELLDLDMFDLDAEHDDDRPTPEDVGDAIYNVYRQRTTKRRNIYKKFANSPYFPGEVDKGLRHLKSKSKANWSGALRHDTDITFT